MQKRLYRSRKNKVLAGVCGGIAEYFAVDPTIVRLIWIALTFAGGAGILVYILAVIIMSEEPYENQNFGSGANSVNSGAPDVSAEFNEFKNDWKEPAAPNSNKNRIVLGGGLILIGIAFLVKHYLSWIDSRFFWPAVIIVIGILLLYKGRRSSI